MHDRDRYARSSPLVMLLVLSACGGGAAAPTHALGAHVVSRRDLAGHPDHPARSDGAAAAGAGRGRGDLDVRGGAADEPADVPRHDPIARTRGCPITTGSTAITPANQPPAQISTQGELQLAAGCRGTFGSVGTPRPRASRRISPASTAPTTFSRRVVLTKGRRQLAMSPLDTDAAAAPPAYSASSPTTGSRSF